MEKESQAAEKKSRAKFSLKETWLRKTGPFNTHPSKRLMAKIKETNTDIKILKLTQKKLKYLERIF